MYFDHPESKCVVEPWPVPARTQQGSPYLIATQGHLTNIAHDFLRRTLWFDTGAYAETVTQRGVHPLPTTIPLFTLNYPDFESLFSLPFYKLPLLLSGTLSPSLPHLHFVFPAPAFHHGAYQKNLRQG